MSALEDMGSAVVMYGFSCLMASRILLPRPGIELVFVALEDGFLSTRPPGKSLFLNSEFITRLKLKNIRIPIAPFYNL